jgi:hypothetical protein
MKKAIFIMLVLLGAGFYNSASAQTKPATTTVDASKTPLAPYLGKNLKIVTHNKDNAAVSHATADYIKFNSNGTYEHTFNGVKTTGTYVYNTTLKTVTIRYTNGVSNTYNFNAPSTAKMALNNTTEEIVLNV